MVVLHQFNSVAQLCLTLCDPMDCSTPGFPVHHQLPEPTQIHAHRVHDAIQPISSSVVPFSSHLQSFPASGSFQTSQLFASGGQSIGVLEYGYTYSSLYCHVTSHPKQWHTRITTIHLICKSRVWTQVGSLLRASHWLTVR